MLSEHEEVTQETLSERKQEMQGAVLDLEEETQKASSDREVKTYDIVLEHNQDEAACSRVDGFGGTGRTCASEAHHQRQYFANNVITHEESADAHRYGRSSVAS